MRDKDVVGSGDLMRGSLMQSEFIYILLACVYKHCTSHGPSRMGYPPRRVKLKIMQRRIVMMLAELRGPTGWGKIPRGKWEIILLSWRVR